GASAPNVPDWKFLLDLDYWMPVFNDYAISFNSKAYISAGYCDEIGDCGLIRWPTHGDINLAVGVGDLNDVWELSLYARNLLHPTEKRYAEAVEDPFAGVETLSLTPARFLNYRLKFMYNFL